jgi:hypothetical protein
MAMQWALCVWATQGTAPGWTLGVMRTPSSTSTREPVLSQFGTHYFLNQLLKFLQFAL